MPSCRFLRFAEKYTQYVYNPGRVGGVLREKLVGWGCAIHFLKALSYSSPKPVPVIFAILFMTGAAGTVALNISYEGLLS